MKYDEQTDAFSMELDNLIKRFLEEFDLNMDTVVGVLEGKKLDILLNCGVDFTSDMDDSLNDNNDLDTGDE